jgi:hypothetical protein
MNRPASRLLALLLLSGAALASLCARADTPADSAQHAQQELKEAGHAAAETAKEGAQKVKQAVKEVVHEGAEKVEEGARKVEEKTKGE